MKTTKPTVSKKKSPKQLKHWYDDYKDIFSYREVPRLPVFYDRLALDCVKWVEEHEEVLLLEEFLIEKHMSYRNWNEMCINWPIIKEANDYCLMLLGMRRENGALHKKLSENIVAFTMPAYSERWRNLMALRSNLTVPQADEATAAIPTIPLTDDVKKQLESKNEDDRNKP